MYLVYKNNDVIGQFSKEQVIAEYGSYIDPMMLTDTLCEITIALSSTEEIRLEVIAND